MEVRSDHFEAAKSRFFDTSSWARHETANLASGNAFPRSSEDRSSCAAGEALVVTENIMATGRQACEDRVGKASHRTTPLFGDDRRSKGMAAADNQGRPDRGRLSPG